MHTCIRSCSALLAFIALLGPAFAGTVVSKPRATKAIVTADDLKGLLIETSADKFVQVEELSFGVDKENKLFMAYWRYVEPGGRVVTKDWRDHAKKIFRSPSDIHGVFVKTAGRDLWVENIVFVGDSKGRFSVDSFSGSLDGVAVAQESAAAYEAGQKSCRLQTVGTACTNLYNSCTGGCGDPPACPCPIFPNGSCHADPIIRCKGTCPVDETCNTLATGWCDCG